MRTAKLMECTAHPAVGCTLMTGCSSVELPGSGIKAVIEAAVSTDCIQRLRRFVNNHPRLLVLTGAGVSTDSGIPDYRDQAGQWKRSSRPVAYRAFMDDSRVRQRYWIRSLVGWRRFIQARPSRAHRALAGLESAGYIHQLVTQNVDGLHQRAGNRCVIDLHGRIDAVVCQSCGRRYARGQFQKLLLALNPQCARLEGKIAPDGDSVVDDSQVGRFRVPVCRQCGGVLKPAVVFFGENVPRARVERVYASLADADAMLVVGSSLMVYSGFRFCRAAEAQGKPIASINLGSTRADELFSLKVEADCGSVLEALAAASLPS